MDPLESVKCPNCDVVYSRSGLHFCTKGKESLATASKYVGGVEFIPLLLKAGQNSQGYDADHRVTLGGMFDGKEVVDIIKTVVLVQWLERTPHPKAGEEHRDKGYNQRYPETIECHRVEPRECMVAVVARSRDDAIANLKGRLDDLAARERDQGALRVKAEEALHDAGERLAKMNEESKKHMAALEHANATNKANYNAKVEAERLVKEMRAELDCIKTKVGTERFDELRKP